MSTDAEIADRITNKRARLLPVLGVLFLANQGIYFSGHSDAGARAVDGARIGAWLFSMLALLILLASGGALFRSRGVRQLVNDEGTIANRAAALGAGFWGAMAAGIAVYLLGLWEDVGARDAVHLIMTTGIGIALIRFGMLEKRALRGG